MGDRDEEERKISMKISLLEGKLENVTLCSVDKLLLGNGI